MVNPDKDIIFNRTNYELQEYLLFCTVVAGKRAWIQAKKLDDWLNEFGKANENPFDTILRLDKEIALDASIKKHKLGQYTRLSLCFAQAAFRHSIGIVDLRTCTPETLEAIPGIGPKTSRFFISHSRPDQRFAVLDTHVLSWLRDQGYDAPKSTPSGKKYADLEKIYLDYCDKNNLEPATLDAQIWNSKRKEIAVNED